MTNAQQTKKVSITLRNCFDPLILSTTVLRFSMSILDAPALHLHALNALQQSDILLAHAPNIGLKEPHTIADVTEEWLTSILNREIADAKVERMSFIEAHEGMTNRHRLSLTWNAAGQAANLPTAIFVKVTPSHGHLREILAMLHMAELECNVYNTVQEDLKDVIPQAYYCRSYPGGRFIIVMEDIVVARLLSIIHIPQLASIDTYMQVLHPQQVMSPLYYFRRVIPGQFHIICITIQHLICGYCPRCRARGKFYLNTTLTVTHPQSNRF
jgi:hypothetical protein